MKCLICQDVKLVIANHQGIEIDYCPECRGIWLGRGELDEIIERALRLPIRQRHEERESKLYAHDSNDYRHNRKEKKKNFIDELLDFSF